MIINYSIQYILIRFILLPQFIPDHLRTLSFKFPLFKNKGKQTVPSFPSKTKKLLSPVCVSQLLGLEPVLECGYTRCNSIQENKPFCSLQPSNAYSSLGRDGTPCPLLPLYAEVLSGLSLSRLDVCHSLCGSFCLIVPGDHWFFAAIHHYLWHLQSSHSLLNLEVRTVR